MQIHWCNQISEYELTYLLQIGQGIKSRILIVGESPALNGWILSGHAFYTKEGKLVPSGVRLNRLLLPFDLKLEDCSFTEICKCFVGKDRRLLKTCGPKCFEIFVKQCELIKPVLLITLGVETLKIINMCTNGNLKIGGISKILVGKIEAQILPVYHPSPVNPKSQKLNENIFVKNNDKIREIIDGLI